MTQRSDTFFSLHFSADCVDHCSPLNLAVSGTETDGVGCPKEEGIHQRCVPKSTIKQTKVSYSVLPQGREHDLEMTQQTMSLQEALASQGQREGAAAVDSLELDD